MRTNNKKQPNRPGHPAVPVAATADAEAVGVGVCSTGVVVPVDAVAFVVRAGTVVCVVRAGAGSVTVGGAVVVRAEAVDSVVRVCFGVVTVLARVVSAASVVRSVVAVRGSPEAERSASRCVVCVDGRPDGASLPPAPQAVSPTMMPNSSQTRTMTRGRRRSRQDRMDDSFRGGGRDASAGVDAPDHSKLMGSVVARRSGQAPITRAISPGRLTFMACAAPSGSRQGNARARRTDAAR
ncbi:hypothetical protein [Actinoplanes sp. NPDC049681]|uniref:hypothetical protein n=1 Tax=Actinoplanes sp. NPDC049681 TaxID=3363905 RepID=UPI0037A5D3CD